MYTRIALGKNRAMDVVSGESSGGTGQLVVLYPLLFGLQGFQCLIGNLPQCSLFPSFTPSDTTRAYRRHLTLLHSLQSACFLFACLSLKMPNVLFISNFENLLQGRVSD